MGITLSPLALVIEYVGDYTLNDLLADTSTLELITKSKIAFDVASALHYMHCMEKEKKKKGEEKKERKRQNQGKRKVTFADISTLELITESKIAVDGASALHYMH